MFSSHRWRPIAHSLRPNVALLLLAAVVCGACGGSTGDGIVTPPPPPPPDPSVASVIAVSQQTVQLSAIGHTATVTATVRDQRGREMPSADVQWTMQDTAVATVSSTGVVVARRNGTTQARVASGHCPPWWRYRSGNVSQRYPAHPAAGSSRRSAIRARSRYLRWTPTACRWPTRCCSGRAPTNRLCACWTAVGSCRWGTVRRRCTHKSTRFGGAEKPRCVNFPPHSSYAVSFPIPWWSVILH